MASITLTVPDNVKDAFDRAFAGEDPGAVIAGLMWQASHDRMRAEEVAATHARRRAAIEAVLKQAS